MPVLAAVFYKLKQYKPQLEEAMKSVDSAATVAEEIYQKSALVMPLFEKLQKLTSDYTNAAASDGISNEEAQTLLADIEVIANDQAVSELKGILEKYTCSEQ